MSFDCFISYASTDLKHAEILFDRLTELGFSVWFDKNRLRPGFDWYDEISAGCASSAVVIAVLTPAWRLSVWTRYETYGARAVLPIWVEGDWTEVAPPPLQRLQRIQINPQIASLGDWHDLRESVRSLVNQPGLLESSRIVDAKHRPTRFFVGREEVLVEIHERLFRCPTAALTQGHVEALTAFGGVGKTTIARQYAEHYWRCYEQIFWVDCSLNPSFGFARIHDLLRPELALSDIGSFERASWALWELSRPTNRPRRLLVLDDAVDEASVASWIPKTGSCHTIITTRYNRWSSEVETVRVDVLDQESAVDLLIRRSGRSNLMEQRSSAGRVAEYLGCLPLALEQAAAYMAKQRDISFDEYLSLYRENEAQFLKRHVRGSTDYPHSLFATLTATRNRLPSAALVLLQLHSFVDSSPLPIAVYLDGWDIIAEFCSHELLPGPSGELEVRELLGLLDDYSTIGLHSDGTLSVHSLVQAVERHGVTSLAANRIECMTRLMLRASSAPSWTPESRRQWDTLLPHAIRLAEHAIDRGLTVDVELLDRVASASHLRGDYPVAISMAREALRTRRAQLDLPTESTLTSQETLAAYLRDAAQYGEAEELQRDVLTTRQARKPHGFESAQSLHALGQILYLSGAVDDAETALSGALKEYARARKAESNEALVCHNDLAVLLGRTRHDYARSKELLEHVVRVCSERLGADHPDTLRGVGNLSRLLVEKDELPEAETLCEKVLEGRRRVLGKSHPETLFSVANMATIRQRQGRLGEAEVLLREAYSARMQVLGIRHPDFRVTARHLAALLDQMSRHDEAVEIRRESE